MLEKCPKDKVEDPIAKVCLDDSFNSQRNYIFYYESERVCLPEWRAGDFVCKDGNNYKGMSNSSNIKEGLNKQLYIFGIMSWNKKIFHESINIWGSQYKQILLDRLS